MNTLNRDKRNVYYCNPTGKTAVTDENGYRTGEYTMTYTVPKLLRASASDGSGQTYISQFGMNLNYAKTLRTSDKVNRPTEGAIIFLDKCIEYEGNIPKGDYIVVKIIESVNFITYGLEKI